MQQAAPDLSAESDRTLAPSVAGVLLFCVACAAHAISIHFGYIWDDAQWIWESPITAVPDGWLLAWTSTRRYDYYPLTSMVMWSLHELFGRQLAYYHLTNVLLHAGCAVLLWRVFAAMKFRYAWIAAMLFAIHPVTVASVAWISQVKNTLSMLFFLASILSFLRFDEKKSWGDIAAAILMFIAACLSKASTVVLPAVLVLLLLWRHRSLSLRRQCWTIPFFLITVGASLLHAHFQHSMAVGEGAMEAATKAPLLTRLTSVGWIVWFYIGKGLLPIGQCMIYPKWDVSPSNWMHHLPNIALGCALIGAWLKRKHAVGRAVLLWLVFMLVALSPVLGLIHMAYHRLSLVSDHLQYIALPGTTAIAAAGVSMLAERFAGQRKTFILLMASSVAAVIFLFSATLNYSQTFENRQTLWAHNVKVNPTATQAYINLGVALREAGKHEEALERFEQAAALSPRDAKIKVNIAVSQAHLGEYAKAKAELARAIELDPMLASAHENLGGIHVVNGDMPAGRKAYLQAIELGQKTGKSEHGLALISDATGDKAMAAHWYARAVEQSPKSLVYRKGLANALLSTDSIEEAWPHMVFVARHDMKPEEAVSLAKRAKAKGHVQRAAELLVMRQSRHPSDAQVGEQLALCFIAEQRYASAASQCSRAYHLHPTRFASAYGLGISATKAGYLAVAELAYRRALKLDSSHRGVRNELAIVLASQGKLRAAENLLEQTLEQYPGDEDVKDNLDQVRSMLKRPLKQGN